MWGTEQDPARALAPPSPERSSPTSMPEVRKRRGARGLSEARQPSAPSGACPGGERLRVPQGPGVRGTIRRTSLELKLGAPTSL